MANTQILVVEDEGLVAQDLKRTLEGLGYEVPAIASTGEAAITKAEETRPDLALMDIVLRGEVDGVNAAEQISNRCDIPVVYLTSHADNDTLQRAKTGEPFGYILKPFDEKELHSVIEMALQKHRKQKALKESRDVLQERVADRSAELAAANAALKQEIADHKQAAKALQESEGRFRSLVESTSDWIWIVDQDGVYTYSSPKVKDLLGYEPDEVVGKRPYDFMPPREATRVATLVRDCFESRSPLVRVENTNLRKDGRLVVLETSGVPIVDDSGNLLGYRGIDRDITEYKQIEESLVDRERRYRRLLAAVTSYTYSVHFQDGVPVSTEHGDGCVSVTGYSPEDYSLDPHLWITMVHPDDQETVEQYVDRILAGEELPPIEHRIVRKDGANRWVRDTIISHCDDDGQLVRYDGVVEDITERKKAQQALWDTEAQLLAAQKIQEGLLPHAAPALWGFDIAGALVPAEYAAGDYFDYLPMPDGSLGVVIGDVAGHGFAPALIMASTHVLLRSLTETRTDVGEILTRANSTLLRETEEQRFVTILFVRLDPETGSLVYASAGHPTGFVLDSAGEIKASLKSTGLPLAIIPDAKSAISGPIKLETGDTILLVTDGIIEARSPARDFFGEERMLEVVSANRDRSACEIVDSLFAAIQEFSQRSTPVDDTTAVVIKVTQ